MSRASSRLENDLSAMDHRSNTPSLTPELSTTIADSLPLIGNTHHMVTRSKADIFKPKVFVIEVIDHEQCMIDEAFAHEEWRVAAQTEYDALIPNRTWELVPLPPGRKTIGCKWLFKIKQNPDGTIARRKGRLVAKGCS